MRMHKFVVAATALMVGGMVAACSSTGDGGTASSGSGAGSASGSTSAASYAGSDCPSPTSALAVAAKKEGTVVWTGTPKGTIASTVPAAFEKEYGITVKFVGASNSQTVARLKSERAAGIYSTDVMTAGGESMINSFYKSGWLAPIKPVLSAATLAGSNWVLGSPQWADPQKDTVLALTNYSDSAIFVNTNLVKSGEIKTWQDLLNPKWKGKIVIQDPRTSGGGAYLVGNLLTSSLGENFVKHLYGDQKPVYLNDSQQEIDGIGRGTYAIGVSLSPDLGATAIQQGLPIAPIVPTGAPLMYTAGSGLLGLNNKAPHPDAAKLLVSWLACRVGNAYFNQAITTPSTRSDVPAPKGVLPYEVVDPKKTYFNTNSYAFLTSGEATAQNTVTSIIGK